MEDEKIIELLFGRSEEALKEIESKYGRLCLGLSENILGNRQDAEECINDAYLSVWEAIPPAHPDPLCAYICKIVRNLSLKRLAREHAAKRNSQYTVSMDELEECLPATGTIEEEIESKALANMIEDFLETLTEENRVIFLRRYWFSDTYESIARQTGLSVKNVSDRLVRLRKALKQFLAKEGVNV